MKTLAFLLIIAAAYAGAWCIAYWPMRWFGDWRMRRFREKCVTRIVEIELKLEARKREIDDE